MNGYTLYISGQVTWFAFGFLAASALWVGLSVIIALDAKKRKAAARSVTGK